MPSMIQKGRQFDARPDRIDFRDRLYRPPLVALPAQYPAQPIIDSYLPRYQQDGMILDQGSEGACTGFGLAAAINYVFWERAQREKIGLPAKVSPRMLYQTARLYDEWQGEDYEGSSCRGAMKGWHRHGVCSEEFWPYWINGEAKFVEPKASWENDAASRPLGAYYRINKDSIVDMQAAINEVHAIYVAAYVHQGWFLKKSKTLPVIPLSAEPTGGHAFAVVGYNEQGFIVQNSWGGDWGYSGFAIMSYADWVQNGMDAWVTLPGAPILTGLLPSTRQSKSLQETVSDAAPVPTITLAGRVASAVVSQPVARWSESEAYRHTVVLGNEGDLLNRLLEAANPDRALEIVAFDGPKQWLKVNGSLKLALYAHGGLNDEEASIKRIRIMAPYFCANGIYPLFISRMQRRPQAVMADSIRLPRSLPVWPAKSTGWRST